MNAYIKTYGCQMNERDSDALAGMLAARGWKIVGNEEDAQLLIFNTCSVREQAERKALGKLMHLKKLKRRDERIIIGVVGCMAQRLGDRLFTELPHVDFVLGTGQLHTLPELVEGLLRDRRRTAVTTDSEEVLSGMSFHHFQDAANPIFGSVAITRGCNRFCSYCIVPYVRGREISRDPSDVVEEVELLAAHGVKEVLLLGQNVAAYGMNGSLKPPAPDQSPFGDLLELVAKVEGIKRIRFTSPYPTYFSDRLISVIAAEPKICRSIHLPLQSGSDRVLKAMNRQYTSGSYLEIVDKLRSAAPGVTFSTDVIVGFPGETGEDFAATRDLMNAVGFENAFIFKYSPRAGTVSAGRADDVPMEVKEERNSILLADLAGRSLAHNLKLIGSTVEVLAEGPSFRNPNRWSGKTSTARSVMFAPIPGVNPGDLVELKIARATHMSLFAANIPDPPENEA